MGQKVINYKNLGLHRSLIKDINGNPTSCIYYKRKDGSDILTKKVVEETMINTYDGTDLIKVVLTIKHYSRFPEVLGDTETEVIKIVNS